MSLLHDIPRAVSDRVHLAALELRRARHAFLRMVVLAVIAAVFAATVWLALWAAIVVTLLDLGVPWYGVCLLVLLFNSLGVWFAIRAAEAQAEYLTLPATVRHLTAHSTAASEPQPHPDPQEAEIAAAHARHDTGAASPGPVSGRASS